MPWTPKFACAVSGVNALSFKADSELLAFGSIVLNLSIFLCLKPTPEINKLFLAVTSGDCFNAVGWLTF